MYQHLACKTSERRIAIARVGSNESLKKDLKPIGIVSFALGHVSAEHCN